MRTLPPLPAALREASRETLEALRAAPELAPAWADPTFAHELGHVLAISRFATRVVDTRAGAVAALAGQGLLGRPYAPGELAARVHDALTGATDEGALGAALRTCRAVETLRIAWRALTGAAGVEETLSELSELADACIGAALDHVEAAARARFGTPRDGDGAPLALVVLGLGKLGGGELNFSSDVDLVYAYPAPGTCDGPRGLDAQEYFTRVARGLTQLLDEPTAHGRVYRVDLRLRPFGSAGPLAAEFDTLEQYYQEHGRDWERYALLKARPCAGDTAAGERLLAQLRPFVYRRYLDFGAIEALREMKAGIEAQVRRGGLEDDLKLGPGGIREIEFIGQVHQLIRGGREPALRIRPIREVLRALAAREVLSAADAQALDAAYCFLRRTENAVQMLDDRQTHALPGEPSERLRVAAALGYGEDVARFDADLAAHRARVREQFEALLGPARAPDDPVPWDAPPEDAGAARALEHLGFPDGVQALRALTALRETRAYASASATAQGRIATLVPLALAVIAKAPDPAGVLDRFLALLEQICRRSAYVALLAENPAALEHLVRLLGASGFLATWLARYPVLLDELLDARTLYTPPTAQSLAAELAARLSPAVRADLERAMETLREVHHAHVLRIAAAELSAGVAAPAHLTMLAQAMVGAALELAGAALAARHGPAPGRVLVVGYGRLGSGEMSYGSDLDLVFLHDAPPGAASTGAQALPAESYFARLAQRTVHILATNTPAGRLYETDLRLRPSGQSGPLVSTLQAFEDYQHHGAWTWEHQALVRARPVAGDAALGEAFEAVRAAVLARPRKAGRLRAEIVAMRERVAQAKGRDAPAGLHLKRGHGGLLDLEFLCQYLVLAHAPASPALRAPRACADILRAAHAAGVLDGPLAQRLADAHAVLAGAERRATLAGAAPASSAPPVAQAAQAVRAAWGALLGQS